MLYDRPYMRQPGFRGDFSFLKAALVTLVAAFIIQSLVEMSVGNEFVTVETGEGTYARTPITPEFLRGNFTMSLEALQQGKIWTLLTYGFLHDGPWHLIFNMLFIFFMGRALEPTLGPRKLGTLYLLATVAGSSFWLLTQGAKSMRGFAVDVPGLSYAPYLLGASAAAMGLLAYFCSQRPNDNITLLLFFIIPCNLKPKWVLWGSLGISAYGVLYSEIFSDRTFVADSVSHSAHLGGLLFGLFYYRLNETRTFLGTKMPSIRVKKPAWMKVSTGKKTVDPPKYSVNFSNRESIQAEVDRILDKINDLGFGALTEDEKKTLDRAKNILNK
jgi:membrane associated rhomboid family serine protease